MPTIYLNQGEDWLERFKKDRYKPPLWKKIKPWQWMVLGAGLLYGGYNYLLPYLWSINWSSFFTVQIG